MSLGSYFPKIYYDEKKQFHGEIQIECPGSTDMQIILCVRNCHSKYKKTAFINAISFLLFFYGHNIEILSAINLYGPLMTLMVRCIVIQ